MAKLELYFIIVSAILTATYIHSALFVLLRANKYENTLAKKIAKEVNDGK